MPNPLLELAGISIVVGLRSNVEGTKSVLADAVNTIRRMKSAWYYRDYCFVVVVDVLGVSRNQCLDISPIHGVIGCDFRGRSTTLSNLHSDIHGESGGISGEVFPIVHARSDLWKVDG